MKALSVRQPWAAWIVQGLKTVENRSWAPPKTIRGKRIAIHASLKVDGRVPLKFQDLHDETNDITDTLGAIIGSVLVMGMITPDGQLDQFISADCETCSALGTVDACGQYGEYYELDCPFCGGTGNLLHDSVTDFYFWERGSYGWVLRLPELRIDEEDGHEFQPLPAKGKLGLWELSDEAMRGAA